MLESLDILIGLSVIMLVLSMGVTMITQGILTVLESRGKFLLQGLTDLLRQIHPNIGAESAKEIAETILKHPVIRRAHGKLGTAIKREELTQMLLEFAAARTAAGPQQPGVASNPFCLLSDEAFNKLQAALAANGITNPGEILDNIRARSLMLERLAPALSTAERQTTAILEEANSKLVAKVHSWFDQTMDRTTERFTNHTGKLTFAASIFLVLLIQLDTVSLVNRLGADEELRNTLVRQGIQMSGSTPQANQEIARKYLDTINATGIIHMPGSGDEWLKNWARVNLGGLLISALLLSLGAPFWYNALSRLVQLRSVLAQKEDEDRKQRESSQLPAGTALSPP
jgi:hypothetical protein